MQRQIQEIAQRVTKDNFKDLSDLITDTSANVNTVQRDMGAGRERLVDMLLTRELETWNQLMQATTDVDKQLRFDQRDKDRVEPDAKGRARWRRQLRRSHSPDEETYYQATFNDKSDASLTCNNQREGYDKSRSSTHVDQSRKRRRGGRRNMGIEPERNTAQLWSWHASLENNTTC